MTFKSVSGFGPRRSSGIRRGHPHIYYSKQKRRWVVRYYDPILKGPRAQQYCTVGLAMQVAACIHERW